MLEKRANGIILRTLHNTGEISVGYLKVLLVYEGLVFKNVTELVKKLQELSDKGYVEFKQPYSVLNGSLRVDITPKGRAVIEGAIPDKDVEV